MTDKENLSRLQVLFRRKAMTEKVLAKENLSDNARKGYEYALRNTNMEIEKEMSHV